MPRLTDLPAPPDADRTPEVSVAPSSDTTERRSRWDAATAASAMGSMLVHAAVLALVLAFAGIRPFESDGAQAIAVDLVTPDDIKPADKAENIPLEDAKKDVEPEAVKPQEITSEETKSEAAKPDAPQAKRDPTPQADDTRNRAQPASESSPQRQPASQPPPTPAPSARAFTPPEPDLTVKYGVPLGLPEPGGRSTFDDVASKAASLAGDTIAAFRRHLRTCSVLPESIAIADDVWIKLRATFRPDGHLAAAPILIEGKASPKALALANGAIAALQACQPYAMLPTDRYGEWKVLDLEFSPKDFRRG